MKKHLAWILPSKLESLLYGFLSILILGGSLIYTHLKTTDPSITYETRVFVGETINSWLSGLSQLPAIENVVQYILWYLLGVVVFSVALYIKRGSDEVVRDFNIAFRYQHPKNFNQLSFWGSIALHAIFHLLAASIILGVIAGLAYLAVPLTEISITGIIYSTDMVRILLSALTFLCFTFISFIWISISLRALFLGRLP